MDESFDDNNELKKTEEALRNSLNELSDYKYALDESALVAITDQKGIIKYVNDKFCQISKYSAEELIGQDHRIINSGYHPKSYIKNLWATIANGKIWKGEFCNKAKDGSIYWVDATIVPFLNKKGKPYQYLAIRVDITERKKAEEELIEKEFFLRESQKAGHIGSYQTNFIKGYWQSSETRDDIFGIDKSYERDIAGWIKIAHPDDQQQMEEYLRLEVIGKQKSFNKEYRIVRINDKQTRWVCGLGNVKFDDSGNITEMIGTIQDITERWQAEKALRLSEEKYRNIFTNALEGIFQIQIDGSYITVNPGFVNMLGYQSPEEFIDTITGTEHQLYVQPERYTKLKQLLDTHNVAHDFEIQMYRKDGSIIWVSLNMRTICDEHGTLLYYEGTAENINEDMKARKSVKLSTLFLKSLGIFAASELLVMFILASLNLSTGIWKSLLDPLLLTILSAPFFYFWVLKGLTRRLVREAAVAQTKAETQEYRYHTLINTAPDIIYTLTAGDGMITMFNPAFEVATGWSSGEWIGKPFAALIYPDDLQFVIDMFEQILRGKNPPPYELRILTKSGTYFVGEFTNVPQFELGKIVGVLGIARDITERKRTEEALRITQFAFDNAGDSIHWIAPDSRIVYVNEAACLMLGYTQQELRELSVPDIDPNYNEEVWSMFFPELREKGSLFFESMQQAKDGRLISVEIRANYIKFGDKELSCAFVRDITERKKAEVQLSKNESKFRHLMDAIPDALLGTNKEGKIVYTNNKASILFGYTTDELLNNKVEMLLPERFRAMHRIYRAGYGAKPVSREGGKIGMPLYGRRKDESEFAAEISLSSIETEEGLVVLSAIRDITEKKKAEQAIINSEARFKKAQEVAHLGNWELDFTNGNTFMSDEACRIHGIPLGQNKQSPETWLSFIHPEDLDFILKNMKEAQDHLSDFVLNYRIKRKDGTIRHIYSETKFQFDSTDKPTGMYGIAHDITERIKAEEELKKYAEALKSSNTELEQFAYIASHDLQEPLRMVTSFMNLLEKRMGGQLDDTNKRYIHFAADGAKRMKTLIQDLLQYSRVGSNKESFTTTNINDVMQYVNQLLEENIKETAATITVKPMPVISANKTLISQLFVNLITNALKYHGDKATEIEVGYTEDPVEYIFYVKDNGIGIDPKFFDKIFIIFQRLHNKSEYSGTGIGLAICKKIVEIHKGKIWVESEPGNGSTFYFSIPIV